MQKLKQFTCPQLEFSVRPFDYPDCEVAKIFIPQHFELPSVLSSLTGTSDITASKLQLHSLVLGLFANIIVPFGGLLGSKLKTRNLAKNGQNYQAEHLGFLDGITDRIDCQLLMVTTTRWGDREREREPPIYT